MEKAAGEVGEKKGALMWAEGNYGSRRGSIGQVRLFTASWGLAFTPSNAESPVHLRCNLPGFRDESWRCKSFADAEERAERVLARWLSLIGASLDA